MLHCVNDVIYAEIFTITNLKNTKFSHLFNYCMLQFQIQRNIYLLLAHFSGTGRESSLPVVSSVVASGLVVVAATASMSMGMLTTLTTPSATKTAQILRNFSISPETKYIMSIIYNKSQVDAAWFIGKLMIEYFNLFWL